MKLFSFLKKKTVSAVLASFEKTLRDLAHVAEHHRSRASDLRQSIHDQEIERDLSNAEASRAESVAARLQHLLNG